MAWLNDSHEAGNSQKGRSLQRHLVEAVPVKIRSELHIHRSSETLSLLSSQATCKVLLSFTGYGLGISRETGMSTVSKRVPELKLVNAVACLTPTQEEVFNSL